MDKTKKIEKITRFENVNDGQYFKNLNNTPFLRDLTDTEFSKYCTPNGKVGSVPRPTRLRDGCYYGINDCEAVIIITKEEALSLLKNKGYL